MTTTTVPVRHVRFMNMHTAFLTMNDGSTLRMAGPLAMANLADILDRAENDDATVEADMSWEPTLRILARALWTD